MNKQRLVTASKAIQRQKDKMPLFADDIVETAQQRIERMEKIGEAEWSRQRAIRAAMWRRGRAAIRACRNAAELAEEWQRSSVPGTAEYLCDFVQRRGV